MSRLHRVLVVESDGFCVARDLEGRDCRVSLLAYEGSPPAAGDWITVHSGYALAPVAREEVTTTLELLGHLEEQEPIKGSKRR